MPMCAVYSELMKQLQNIMEQSEVILTRSVSDGLFSIINEEHFEGKEK
jgi:hypothetical protein